MNDPDVSAFLTTEETAQLLGFSPGELDQLRRKRKISAEPFRKNWWHFFPEFRYSERAVLDFHWSDTASDFNNVESSPLVRMANCIIVEALQNAASDIHVEPDRRNLRVRFRINGTLHEIMAIPKHITDPLTRRYLLMAKTSNPFNLGSLQTGIIRICSQRRYYDIRLSSMPSRYGAKLVMRLLPGPAPTRWEELGMSDAQAAQTADLLQSGVPGLTLFAAPQGEGLTTMFRCALFNANRPEHNLYFLDDIADFPAAGITRVLLDPANGMTAAEAVRAAKRQGATLIVFGEITDRETARVAVETAESGLSVWAGVRVPGFEMNSTPRSSVRILWTRFQGFGIAPERLEPVLRGAVMARLIRTLCPDCKEGIPVSDPEAFQIETHGVVAPSVVFQAKGCDLCRKTGYRNRTGLFALYTGSPMGYDRSSFAQGAVSLFASGEADAAELCRLRVWTRA
ncbi:MAG: Flp pilus assembly complex ATPase component TadA [Fibrella sp.]|nr:Flp pilus assembly complex ATPase component TadA [Armatimonadota bacterium]